MEYVISKEQKQTLTGVRNDLWLQLQRMMSPTDVAVPFTCAELHNLVERLERVVQPLDDLDNRRMDELIDYYRGYADEYGFQSVWSMWEDPTSAHWSRVWMESPHPYGEGTEIEYDATMGNGKTYKVVVDGPLWIDVWKACELLIELSTDSHHRYIENLREREDGVLTLVTGS